MPRPRLRTAQVTDRAALSCPVTALAAIPDTDCVLIGSGRQLSFVSLNSTRRPRRTWTVFRRDRIHRIALADTSEAAGEPTRRALVVGGKEAVLVELSLNGTGAGLELVQRFQLDDFAGDGAFLDDDLVLLSTLHNSIHVYSLALAPPPDPSPSSPAPPGTLPPTRPSYTLHAAQRPTLWCTRFDRAHYRSSAGGERAEDERDEPAIRFAGGSLWGDTFLWDVGTAGRTASKVRQVASVAERMSEIGVEETLRRLAGHKGAVFTAAFSPCTRFLVTGSDDRTLRVWNLAHLPPPSPTSPSTPSAAHGAQPNPHVTLWGHSARVWRAVFLPASHPPCSSSSPLVNDDMGSDTAPGDDLRIASVAEDGTARVWRVSRSALSPSCASPSLSARPAPREDAHSLLATFREGHDGRSLWAVEGAVLRPAAETGRGTEVLLTGGADGAVRSWVTPSGNKSLQPRGRGEAAGGRRKKSGKVKAFVAAPGVEGDLVVALRDDGSFTVPSPPSSGTLSTLLTAREPFHTSPSWAGVSPTAILHLIPPLSSSTSSSHSDRLEPAWTLLAFSNRGSFLHARLSPAGELVGEVVELTMGVRPALVALGALGGEDLDRKLRVAVWDRAAWRVVLLEVDLTSAAAHTSPVVVATLALPPGAQHAPTALRLLTPSFLLVGTASGSLALYATLPGAHTDATAQSTLERLGGLEQLHSDGIADLSVRSYSGDEQRWLITSVGKDAARCVTHVEVRMEDERQRATFEVRDDRVLSKGSLDEVIDAGGPQEQYLAHSEGRAVVLDHLGQQVRFPPPTTKVPSQLVRSRDGALRYYSLVAGQLQLQSVPAAASVLSPILRPGLHGREIRAVEVATMGEQGDALVATAAENGVLSVSKLHPDDNRLEPLWTARHLPSALKALAWSPLSSSAPSSSSPPALTRVLFACGAQELLLAFSVSRSAGQGALEVRPVGQVGGEGGEVRAMDFAVVPAAAGAHAVAVGYSDGSLRVWRHDASASTLTLVARSQETSKCVLAVEVVEVEVKEAERRWVVATGASDGLLALHDLTRFVSPSLFPVRPARSDATPHLDSLAQRAPAASTTLPPAFCAFRPHQSGINALSLHVIGPALLVATGGDDNALCVSSLALSFSLETASSEVALLAQVVGQASLPDAHASTIQGLDFLSSTLLASSSVEQRLNLYSLSSSKRAEDEAVTAEPELTLCDSTTLDVADCGAQAVLPLPDARWTVVVAGIGAEAVEVRARGDEL